jgi:plasmid stabilization system protein ParE
VKYAVSFRAEVPLDLASAADWYDNQRQGLGDEFLNEYRVALDGLVKSPLARVADPTGMRFRRMKRFPYRICYRVCEDEIVVAAIFHARRDPNRLLDRGSSG